MRKILFYFFTPHPWMKSRDFTKNLQFSESYGRTSDLDALIIMPGHEKAKSWTAAAETLAISGIHGD